MLQVNDEVISIVAGEETFTRYDDLLGNVRNDGKFYHVRSLVQPDDPEVRQVAQVLLGTDDFIEAAQVFVNSFTIYSMEVGDYWATPAETLSRRCPECMGSVAEIKNSLHSGEEAIYRCDNCRWSGEGVQVGDCDDMAILLCSILRNSLPASSVYCAFGLWKHEGKSEGHMWVVMEGDGGQDRVLEATAPPGVELVGKYILHGMFNDSYCFATDIGLKEFGLKVAELEKVS